MKDFRILFGFMVVLFVAFMSLSAVASAQGKDVPNGKGFQELQEQIDNIELTPGPKGDKGDKGDTGDQGLKGDKGDTGDQGLKGDKGDTGDQGLKGDKGDTGDQGLKGDKGDTGDQGLKGDKGDTGDQGLKGDKGDPGTNGVDGQNGTDGTPGAKGEPGTNGTNGADGVGIVQTIDNGNGTFTITYSDGTTFTTADLTGAKGDTGDQGLKGDKGDPGTNGTNGTNGADGADGADGFDGLDGTTPWTELDGYSSISTTGSIRIGEDSTICDDTYEGTIRYNATTHAFEGCDGTAWVSLSTSASSSFVCGTDQVQDNDGNLYDTVLIGSQCWMAENLNVGTMVNGTTSMTHNTVIEKYCYSNDADKCATEGGLYYWNEMMQYSTTPGVRGICPAYWHVPTDAEWKTLEMELGMPQGELEQFFWDDSPRGEDQALQLIVGGTSGFEAMMTGMGSNGGFFSIGDYATYWTSSIHEDVHEPGPYWPIVREIYDKEVNGILDLNRTTGMGPNEDDAWVRSVRCVKD